MSRIRVWDPVIRLFHWSLVGLFLANALFTRPGKDVHVWVGYAIGALLLVRVIWGFAGSRHARFSDFPPAPAAALGQLSEMATGRRIRHAGHSPLGALMVYNILLTMTGIVATGYAMTTVTFFGVEWVEELHEALVTWAEFSAVVHVAAVLFETRRLGVNLPKAMLTGYKVMPATQARGK